MKFSEIPQLIRGGAYECNFALTSVANQLEEWKLDSGLQLNPDFQRGVVWTVEQQIAFMEYFLRGGRSGMVIFFNKPSWQDLGTSIKRTYDDFVCVDGLQRLTAILRFMNDEIPAFGQLYHEYDEPIRMAPNGHGLRFNVNNLQTREDVLEWYLQMNDGGTPHTAAEIGRVRELLRAEKEKSLRPPGKRK